MATLTGNIFSKVLDMDTSITVISSRKNIDFEHPYRAIYMLHGLTDNNSSWGYNAQLSLLAEKYNVMFIMPDAQRSFFIDMKYGLRYFTYVSEELPRLCGNLFRLYGNRENTYVFGLSMGGYGALRCALQRPDVFAGCGAFSPCCNLHELVNAAGPGNRELQGAFGLDYEGVAENDLYPMVLSGANSPQKARYYLTWGEQDYVRPMCLQFKGQMLENHYDLASAEIPGHHEWYFWNSSVHMAMEHFFGA